MIIWFGTAPDFVREAFSQWHLGRELSPVSYAAISQFGLVDGQHLGSRARMVDKESKASLASELSGVISDASFQVAAIVESEYGSGVSANEIWALVLGLGLDLAWGHLDYVESDLQVFVMPDDEMDFGVHAYPQDKWANLWWRKLRRASTPEKGEQTIEMDSTRGRQLLACAEDIANILPSDAVKQYSQNSSIPHVAVRRLVMLEIARQCLTSGVIPDPRNVSMPADIASWSWQGRSPWKHIG